VEISQQAANYFELIAWPDEQVCVLFFGVSRTPAFPAADSSARTVVVPIAITRPNAAFMMSAADLVNTEALAVHDV